MPSLLNSFPQFLWITIGRTSKLVSRRGVAADGCFLDSNHAYRRSVAWLKDLKFKKTSMEPFSGNYLVGLFLIMSAENFLVYICIWASLQGVLAGALPSADASCCPSALLSLCGSNY